MKKFIHFLFLLSICTHVMGQEGRKLNAPLQKKLGNARLANREIAVFVKGNPEDIRTATERLGGVFKYAAGDIAAIRIPLSKIPELAGIGSVSRIESDESRWQPMNDQVLVNNHAWEVQHGINLPQDYDGRGVVVGIIDEGIDFTHPDFRDEFGRTRIKYLWDQAIINFDPATQAQPYGYGKEYAGNQIDTSTQHHDSPFSHGSHVAGIACGNGLAVNNYSGVAPKSDMIIVKMNLNQTDNSFLSSLVDAIKYIFDRADQLGEPAVINISLGTYFGSHDGKDIQAQAIDNLITSHPGHVVVCSAGNAGSAPLHLGYNTGPDTAFTWMQYSSQSIYVEAWGDSADFVNAGFSIGIDRVNPDRHFLGNIPFNTVAAYAGTTHYDTLWQGNQRLGVVEINSQVWNGSASLSFQIYPDSVMNINSSDTSVYYWRIMTQGSGHIDAWSLDFVFDNLPDSATYPFIRKYKTPDTDQTIVSSFTCSDKVITVGSYVNRNFYTNANYAITRDTTLHPGQLSTFSSHGPTRDGRIKPDLIATGEWVMSCGTQAELNILSATEPEKVAAGKKHKRSSGTSMSSPVVAGIAALYLQKNPTADWLEVKNALIHCTDQDGFTGTNLPDNRWGYGKVNAYSTVKGCSVGIDETNPGLIDFGNYPNPFTASTLLHYDLSSLDHFKVAEVRVTDMLGNIIQTFRLKEKANAMQLSCDGWSSGVYTCSLVVDGRILRSVKWVVF